MRPLGRVLIIAGSDSGGGAGVQADIKTVTALGGYAATAITAITVQNTLGVEAAYPLPAELVAAQARAVLADIGADVITAGGDRSGDGRQGRGAASRRGGAGRGVAPAGPARGAAHPQRSGGGGADRS